MSSCMARHEMGQKWLFKRSQWPRGEDGSISNAIRFDLPLHRWQDLFPTPSSSICFSCLWDIETPSLTTSSAAQLTDDTAVLNYISSS
jgi:hypothetical protein